MLLLALGLFVASEEPWSRNDRGPALAGGALLATLGSSIRGLRPARSGRTT